MSRRGTFVSLGGATAVLLFAMGLLWRGHSQIKAKHPGKTGDLIPAAAGLSGWSVKDAPIADTPEMQRRVDDVLNYDDASYRIYTRGDLRISVYLAYWRPGKMLVRSIAHHTPDVCWTLAGWECIERNTLKSGDQRMGVGVGHTEHRVFKAHGQTEHVVFWHIAGDQIISYQTGAKPPWHATLTDTFKWGLEQKQEQFFLRVSSNQPLEVFMGTNLLQMILAGFPVIRHPHL